MKLAKNNLPGIIVIGDSIIDFSRNQITTNGNNLSIEPKVMKVLHLLIQHSGEVVSQESIHQEVWGNGVFNQSLIQRAIALLRQALNDNAKCPVFIATFPKKGYSFIKPIKKVQNSVSTQYLSLIAGICFVAIAFFVIKGINPFNKVEQPVKNFNISTPVTSTPEQELFAKATINGEFIGFIRQINSNSQQIWIKNLQSHVEFPVSEVHESILSFDWSIDGDFISYSTLEKKQYHIYVTSISRTHQKIELANDIITLNGFSRMSELFWLNDYEIVFIGYHQINQQHQVIKLNSITAKLTTVWQMKSGKAYTHASLKRNKSQLAFTTLTESNNSQIIILDLKRLIINKLNVTLPPFIHITWEFSGEHLLVSDPLRKSLQLVSLNGKKQTLSIAHHNAGLYPQYLAPQQLVMTMQMKKSDIVSWDYIVNEKETIADSNNMDYFPMLSPNGKKLVFVSNRDGENKLYIKRGETTILLPNVQSSQSKIDRPIWSANSKSIAYLLDNRLFIQTLGREQVTQVDSSASILSLFDWVDDKTLLILVNNGGKKLLATLDIINNNVTTITEFSGLNAHIDSVGNIWKISKNSISTFDISTHKWRILNTLKNIEWSVKGNNAFYLQRKNENKNVIVKINLDGTIVDEFNYPFEQLIILHSVDKNKFYFNSKFRTLSDVFLLSTSK